jgi:hypothetical protein
MSAASDQYLSQRYPDPPTGLEYTFVPRANEINTEECIDEYLDKLPYPFRMLFRLINVRGDGNCGYYVFQLFLEWRSSLSCSEDLPPIVNVATFRQHFRQYLQDVGCDYFKNYLPSNIDFKKVLNRVYDPTKREVMDYYNNVHNCLPEKEWATDDDIVMMARWAGVENVVIFSKSAVRIATQLNGDDLPDGTAPLAWYLDVLKKDEVKRHQQLICGMKRNNSLFVFHTGCHYMWLKVDEALIPSAVAVKCVQSPKKRKGQDSSDSKVSQPLPKSPKTPPANSPNVESGKKAPAKEVCAACNARNKECIICVTLAPSVAFIPCGHVIICKDCISYKDQMTHCPACRTQIQCTLQLYL